MRYIFFFFIVPFLANAEIISEGDFYHYSNVAPYELVGDGCPTVNSVYKDLNSLGNAFLSNCYVKNTWADVPEVQFQITNYKILPTGAHRLQVEFSYIDSYERKIQALVAYQIKPCPSGYVLDTSQNACVTPVCQDYVDCFNKYHNEACSSGQIATDYIFTSISNFKFTCAMDNKENAKGSAYLSFVCGGNTTFIGQFNGSNNTYTSESVCRSYIQQYFNDIEPVTGEDGVSYGWVWGDECWVNYAGSPPNGRFGAYKCAVLASSSDGTGDSGGDGSGSSSGGSSGGGSSGGTDSGSDTDSTNTTSFDDTRIVNKLNDIDQNITDSTAEIKSSVDALDTNLEAISQASTDASNSLSSIDNYLTSNRTVGLNSAPTSNARSFYQTSYPQGFSGIWNTHSEGLKQTSFVQWTDQFKIQLSGGDVPPWSFCINMGDRIGNYGCHSFDLDSRIWAAIRIFIMFSAGLLCRRLVFGG